MTQPLKKQTPADVKLPTILIREDFQMFNPKFQYMLLHQVIRCDSPSHRVLFAQFVLNGFTRRISGRRYALALRVLRAVNRQRMLTSCGGQYITREKNTVALPYQHAGRPIYIEVARVVFY